MEYSNVMCLSWKTRISLQTRLTLSLKASMVFIAICIPGLNFSEIPKIRKFAFDENVQEMEVVSVTCLATSQEKPLSFQWSRNGFDLRKSTKGVRIEDSNEFSVLIIDPVTLTSDGNYTCIASNSHGSDKHTAHLSVKAAPKWHQLPQNMTVTVGASAKVTCMASGSPSPHILWKKISDDLSSSNLNGLTLTSAKGNVFEIQSASYADAGLYACVAENGIPPNLQANFSIIVRVPARFEENFAVVTAKKGDSASLKCEALGDQPLSVSWHREKNILTKNEDNRYEIFETLTSKGMISELIIRTTDREDGALYSCFTENEFGSDERKIRLLVMEVPAPPLDVKIRETWSRSASASWAPPYSGNSPITKYIVQYWRDAGRSPHRLHEISAPSSQSSVLLKDLHPGTAYVVKVVAENAVGRGEPSDAVNFRTGEEEPNSPPTDIIADPRGSSTIRVSWKPPPKDSWNGDVRGYYVGYKTRSSLPYSYKTVDYVVDAEQEFFLTNLLKASDYSIVVKAFNSAGSGPPSPELYVTTLDGDLPPAPSLYVLASSGASVSLRWNTRKVDNPLSGYTVHYRQEQGQWQEVAVVAPEDNTYTLANLQSGKLYQIYVTATNQYGKGDPSEIVAVKTEDGDGRSLLSVSSFGSHGNYGDMAVFIPVAASLLTICVVLIIACVCVKKIKSRQNLERALAAEKHLAMVGTLQRYVDIDKTRSLMAQDPNMIGHYPSPYETIPMPEDQDTPLQGKDGTNQELRSFIAKDNRDTQTLYNKPASLRRKDDHIYDSAQ